MTIISQKNFHYIFNLRDLSNVFAGMLFSTHVRNLSDHTLAKFSLKLCVLNQECVKTPEDLTRLWVHETSRVSCWKPIGIFFLQVENPDQNIFFLRFTGTSSQILKIWTHLTKRRRTS